MQERDSCGEQLQLAQQQCAAAQAEAQRAQHQAAAGAEADVDSEEVARLQAALQVRLINTHCGCMRGMLHTACHNMAARPVSGTHNRRC